MSYTKKPTTVSGGAWLRFTSFLHLRPPKKVSRFARPRETKVLFSMCKKRHCAQFGARRWDVSSPKLMHLDFSGFFFRRDPDKSVPNDFRAPKREVRSISSLQFQYVPGFPGHGNFQCCQVQPIRENPSPAQPGSSTRSGHRTRCH